MMFMLRIIYLSDWPTSTRHTQNWLVKYEDSCLHIARILLTGEFSSGETSHCESVRHFMILCDVDDNNRKFEQQNDKCKLLKFNFDVGSFFFEPQEENNPATLHPAVSQPCEKQFGIFWKQPNEPRWCAILKSNIFFRIPHAGIFRWLCLDIID